MSEPLSQPFVTAFLTACFDAGLTKEAAASLLQKESEDRACRGRPHFAEGYYRELGKRASAAMEKRANPFGALMRGGGRLLRGVGRVIKNNPRAAGLGAAGLGTAGLGAWGGIQAHNYLTRDQRLGLDDPFFGAGSHIPGDYDEHLKELTGRYEPAIFASNRAYEQSADRLKELEAAVASGKAGGGAYRDLAALRRSHAGLAARRDAHLDGLQGIRSDREALLPALDERAAELESQRTSIWGLPKRWAAGGFGWGPWGVADPAKADAYFDERIGRIHDRMARTQADIDLADARSNLLESMATRRDPAQPPTGQQMQETFFPSFGTVGGN